MNRVEAICRRFIDDNKINCPEAVYQVDKVIENAYEFIEEICNVMGYWKDPEEVELNDNDVGC